MAAVTLLLAACGQGEVGGAGPQTATEDETATIASLTGNSERRDGMFTLFRDRDDGTVRLLIPAEGLGKEYIYFAGIQDAPVATGQFRGNVGVWAKNGVVRVDRHFNRVEFVQENVAFHFDPDTPLSRASEANISPAVLAVTEILAEDEDGAVLIDAGPVFLSEAFMQLKPSPDPEATEPPTFDMGSLSDDKTRFTDWRAYPENVDVFVEYVYENPAPAEYEDEDLADPRFVSMFVQHGLVRMPESDFQPRSYDPRVGFFVSRQADLTSISAAPWLDHIDRWHLQKKNPGAELSEPVEPIVFWLENTTPLEFRDTVLSAGRAWNEAFEKAGFKNAIQMKIQPDDADWDAGDIRYNVLRWTSAPTSPFGGFGPRVVNPRTGQIIGADIMLDTVFTTSRVRYERMFAVGKTPGSAPVPAGSSCLAAHYAQMNNIVGRTVLRSRGYGEVEQRELLDQGIRELVLHEMGHSLGLSHNFIASQMLSTDDLYSQETTGRLGTSGSVMEYSPANVAPRGREQGMFYDVRPGPYDRWAIEYGYSQAQEDVQAEQARLEAILKRSTERPLWFANDADDMRSPGAGIDPRVMIFDRSSDAIQYAENQFGLIRDTVADLTAVYAEPGASWQEMVTAYLMLGGWYSSQAQAVSRYVGGVYVDRAVQGQSGATEPYRPVPVAEQRRALATLGRYVFAADAFAAPESLYRRLQTQRRDFDFGGKTEDPKIHAQALAVQKTVLDHLLHPVVMKRLTDSSLYGNEYRVSDMITDLTDAVFDADLAGNVNGFRQNLQSEYVGRLVKVIAEDNAGDYDQPSRAMALYTLQDLRRLLSAKRGGDVATRAHTAALVHTIDKALETG